MKTRITVLLFCVLLLGGCVNTDEILSSFKSLGGPSEQEIAEAEVTSLATLLKDFRENDVYARQKYEGRWLKLSGYIVNSPQEVKSGNGGFTIHLSDTNKNVHMSTEILPCTFSKNDRDTILTLRRGQFVTLYGKFTLTDQIATYKVMHYCKIISKK